MPRKKTHKFIQITLSGLCTLALVCQAGAQSASARKGTNEIHGERIGSTPPQQTTATNTAIKSLSLAAPKPVAATNGVPGMVDLSRDLDWDYLASYEFETPATSATNLTEAVKEANKQIPAAIKTLDGKTVCLTGFILPLKTEKGQVTQFLITRSQAMCCFGFMPKITEWVNVKLKGEGMEMVPMDEPITVKGTLHVGAATEEHAIVDVYRMDQAHMVDN